MNSDTEDMPSDELATLRVENKMLRLSMTDWRYSHDEIEAACDFDTAMMVRKKVMHRRNAILAAISR